MKNWKNILLYCLLAALPGCDSLKCPTDSGNPPSDGIIWQTDISDEHKWQGYNPHQGATNLDLDALRALAGDFALTWLALGHGSGVGEVVIRTQDGGDNWTIASSSSQPLEDIASDGTLNTFIAVGANGTILRTQNGGDNWDSIPSPLSRGLISIDIQPNAFGIIVPGPADLGQQQEILRSTNETTWSTVNIPNSLNVSLHRVAIRPPSTAFLVGERNGTTAVFRSSDKGASWQGLQVPDIGTALDVTISKDTVVVIADNGKGIIRSTDNGNTWQSIAFPSGGLRRIAYYEGNWVIAAASDFYLSTDNATTWTKQNNDRTGPLVNDLILYGGQGSGSFQGFAVGN